MRAKLSWPIVVVLAAALPSCLFLEDFGELQGGDATSSASSSGSSGLPAASSVASGDPTSSSSSASSGGEGGKGGEGGDATGSTGTSSSSDGGAGASGSQGSGGSGGSGGDGGGPITGPTVSPFDAGSIFHGTHDGCDLVISDIATVPHEGQSDFLVVGTTWSREGGACTTYAPVSANIDEVPGPGESASWILRSGGISGSENLALVTHGPSAVRLAVADEQIFAAFDGGVDEDSGKQILVIREVTDFHSNPATYPEFHLLADQIRLTDLFAADGRVYATGSIDGESAFGGDCTGADDGEVFNDAGFVWSVDGSSCDLGTFGPDTVVWSGVGPGPITLAVSGEIDFDIQHPCYRQDDVGTLRLVDVEAGTASELVDLENCIVAPQVGAGLPPLPATPLALAAGTDVQLISVIDADGASLIRREQLSEDLDEKHFDGDVKEVVPFATGVGSLGAVGRYSGVLRYGEFTPPSADGDAAFLVTFQGNIAGCAFLDAAALGGPFDEGFTAAFGNPADIDGVFLGGQWQDGLGTELGFDPLDADAYDTSAFFTTVRFTPEE